MSVRRIVIAVVVFAASAPLVRAQGRTEVTVNDSGRQAENLTSSQDGSAYFGSTAKGTIYRVTELTVESNRAEVRVVKDGLSGATGVTLVGDTALVLVERAKAVVVPYRRQ
jgi:hypothetical protein